MTWSTPADALVVLGGAPNLCVGMTFVPDAALRELRWGVGAPTDLMVAACERMKPDFVFVPAWEPWADEAADRIAALGTDVFWVVAGPFGVIANREGWPDTLKRTLGDPSSLRVEMRRELSLIVEQVRRGAALGVRSIVVAEDMAGSNAMLFSPDFALDEVIPLLAEIVELCAEEMVPAVLHSDGDIRVLMSAIHRAGFAGVHLSGGTFDSFERLFESARAVGLGVVGGLETATLGQGTASAMAAGTRVALLARRGGLLIADDGGITSGIEVASMVSAFEAARRTWDEAQAVT